MQEVFEKTTSGLEHEKIKTNYAEIIIKHPLEKPYYAIIYFDLTDGELHEGFGSYCLEYVVEWKRDYFEIVDQVAKEFAGDTNVGHKTKYIQSSERVCDLVDKIFSHNEVVALWKEEKDEISYHKLLWRGMAWDIPKEYKTCKFVKIFGTIPESITEADTINIEVEND